MKTPAHTFAWEQIPAPGGAALPGVLHPGELPGKPRELRSGDPCPTCGEQRLDYDGMLNLACPVCGPASGGCFT